LQTRDKLAGDIIPALLEAIRRHLEAATITLKTILDAFLRITLNDLYDFFGSNFGPHNPPSTGSPLENNLSKSLAPEQRQHMRRAYRHS